MCSVHAVLERGKARRGPLTGRFGLPPQRSETQSIPAVPFKPKLKWKYRKRRKKKKEDEDEDEEDRQ